MRFTVALVALLGLCCVTLAAPRCCTDYCYSSDVLRPQNIRMNTKTAYQLVRGGQSANIPAGCTPSKFWLLNRHGTRLPSTSKIQKLEGLPDYQAEIVKNYANGNQPAVGALCAADLALLTNWRWDTNISSTMDEYLTHQGWDDLKGIAQHYKTQYPTLLGGTYSADKFLFRHTNTQRTQASYQAFVDGLFGDNAHKNIPAPNVPTQDTFLRPFDFCSKWADQEAALENSKSELSKFEASDLYLQVISDVSTKAGYSSALKANRIEWMFEMCFYELAWELNRDSPWCSLFTLDQVKIFEYAKDMEEWYLGGPSTTLNSRLTCELVQDLLAKLDSQDGQPAVAYFSHSTTLQLFLTALGAVDGDLPLLADNYELQANRKWQTAQVSPFATNVAAVRYDCASGTKVQFWLNERPINFDWCTNGLCDLADVKAKFATLAGATCSSYYCSN